MSPDAGPGGSNVVLAQVTTPAGVSFSASALLQGRSAGGAGQGSDWQAAVAWSVDGGATTPSPPAPPAGASGGVQTMAASAAGMSTYRLTYTTTAEQTNVYALAGTVATPMSFPAAFQVATPFGSNTGGVNPAFFATNADSEFDSWLTVGMTDGSAPAALGSSPGLGLDAWTLTAPFSTSDGAVFWMSPDAGPTGADIVLAQVTVPAGVDFSASALLQGRSSVGAGVGSDWQAAVAWTTAAGPAPPAAPCPAGATCGVQTMTASAAGMSTYRLTYTTTAEQTNVYAMAGVAATPMSFPAAFQVATPFGADVGGVSPMFFPINADAEFDSWLSVGMTDGSAPGAIGSSPGLGLSDWGPTSPLTTSDGAVFWMLPDDGPTGADIVLAQVTVASGSTFTSSALLQGRSAQGDDWQSEVGWSV